VVAEEEIEYSLLLNGTAQSGSFGSTDASAWQYAHYRVQTGRQATTVHVEVSSGEGVWVSVRDQPCAEESTFFRNVWCAATLDQVWQCDVEVSAEADYYWSGDALYVEVYGRMATYTVGAMVGEENCEVPSAAGLDFCADYITYPVWRWADQSSRDSEARCRYEQLLSFVDDGALNLLESCDYLYETCPLYASPQCKSALQQFSCYESFKPCDAQGFERATCSQVCSQVEYFCLPKRFRLEHVGLGYLACSSNRYVQEYEQGVCAGSEVRIDQLQLSNRPLNEQVEAAEAELLEPFF
jgi:hypothetical protein